MKFNFIPVATTHILINPFYGVFSKNQTNTYIQVMDVIFINSNINSFWPFYSNYLVSQGTFRNVSYQNGDFFFLFLTLNLL